MSSESKQVIQRMYDAYRRGDIEQILGNLTDDFMWNVPGPAPFAGIRSGRDGMREFFDLMGKTVEVDQFDVNEILSDGDKVVVLGKERSKIRATGSTYESDFAHVWTLRGGRVSHGQVFADTAAAGAAWGESSRERQALTGSLGITHPAFSGRGNPE
jgi:ketosteroid isomerase-like protein